MSKDKKQKLPKQKGLFKRFAGYYKPHKKLFIIDMICALTIAVFNLFYPTMTKEIINNYVPNKMLNMLISSSCLILGFYVIKAILNYVITYWGHVVGVRIQADMRRELFLHLQKLPFSYFDENKTGAIMSRMTNDLFSVAELAHHGPEDVFLSIVTIIGAFVMLALCNIYLTLIVFAFIPFVVLIAMIMRKRMKKVYGEMRVAQAEINADVESAISGMRVSRAYTAEKHECEKFDNSNGNFKAVKSRQYKVMGQFHSSMIFFTDFLYFVILLAGGLFFYYGKINGGEFTAFILYISTLITPIRTLVSIYDQIQEGASGFSRFCEIMDKSPEDEKSDAIVLDRLNGDIEFSDVTFGYKSDDEANKVITNFSMSVPSGKTIALVGPSGGGKTTLCHLIPRFYEIDSGKITIDGYDIQDLSHYTLRKNIGIVQQDVFLFNGTIKENIAYGDFDATNEQIIEAAKRANIHEYVMSLPDGYDTAVGERGVKLSGGQKQRVSIARAFLKNPPILILDEATSALDNATEVLIQDALNELSVGRTTIVVAHRLSTIKNADEIIVITPNGAEERGTHSELLDKGGIYANLYAAYTKPLKA